MLLSAAIRFGRMPQSEKLKLKAEMVTGDREVEDPQVADQKTLARQIYEAYLKNFNMNKAKARTILTGKTSNPVRWLRVVGWWVKDGVYVCGWLCVFMALSSQVEFMSSCFIYFFPILVILILSLVHSKFVNRFMSQYDLANKTLEIMCSQPMTEMTFSISSASQHTCWAGQGNVCLHGNSIKSQCMSPSRLLLPVSLYFCAILINPP